MINNARHRASQNCRRIRGHCRRRRDRCCCRSDRSGGGCRPEPGTFVATTPTRLLDTRQNLGGSALAPNGVLDLPIAGQAGLPAAGQVAAVVLNVTVTSPGAGGYITVWGHTDPQPVASNLNFSAAPDGCELGDVAGGHRRRDRLLQRITRHHPAHRRRRRLLPRRHRLGRGGVPRRESVPAARHAVGIRGHDHGSPCDTGPSRRRSGWTSGRFADVGRGPERDGHPTDHHRLHHRLGRWHTPAHRVERQLQRGPDRAEPRRRAGRCRRQGRLVQRLARVDSADRGRLRLLPGGPAHRRRRVRVGGADAPARHPNRAGWHRPRNVRARQSDRGRSESASVLRHLGRRPQRDRDPARLGRLPHRLG